MAIKASGQATIIDLTDGYSILFSNENVTFQGDTTKANSGQTTTVDVVALCGGNIVACTIGDLTGVPTGLTYSKTSTKSPSITFTVGSTMTSLAGAIAIPVTITDTEVSITKYLNYSVALTGSTGAAGRSLTGVTEYYLATSASSGVTTSTSGWTTTVQTISKDKPYLWNYEKSTYANPASTESSTPIIIGHFGTDGNNGKGISSVTNYYATTTTLSAPAKSTGSPWSTTVKNTDSTNRYLWNWERTTYTDNTTSDTNPHLIAVQGTNGEDTVSITIDSSAGFIFKNSNISTTLTARVFVGASEVTGTTLANLGTVKWYLGQSTTATTQNVTVDQTTKRSSLSINGSDVEDRLVVTAQLEG